jgi:solute carrier family 38 (sodium-coupled neutral amino acid transporter), member 11
MLILFMIFASVAYTVYKGDCESIFIQNLRPINELVTAINVCVCINCFISYPLQILAAFDIAEQHEFFKTGENTKIKKVIMRSLVIFFVTGIALIIPNFTLFLDISGSIGASIIGFVLPPLLYNAEFKYTLSNWTIYSNYAIVLFGVIGGTLSIINSVWTIADEEEIDDR